MPATVKVYSIGRDSNTPIHNLPAATATGLALLGDLELADRVIRYCDAAEAGTVPVLYALAAAREGIAEIRARRAGVAA